MQRFVWILVAMSLALALQGCGPEVVDVVVHRSNCEVCHSPRVPGGEPMGIEDVHPWAELACVDCHGGNDWVCDGEESVADDGDRECSTGWIYDKDRAHVLPGPDEPAFLKNLTTWQLDQINPAYVKFINPGDLRVAGETCGPCHAEAVDKVPRSTMAHTSGEVTVARYRAGAQDTPRGIYGAINVTDPNKPADEPCAVDSLTRMEPPAVIVGSTDPLTEPSVANLQDLYMAKSCFRCHLSDFGENRFPGDFRSSGCSACHMQYADDGLSQSADPRISRVTAPHPITHEMTATPTYETCTHCHYRGGRIGISYQGYRESGGAAQNPDRPEVLGLGIHGHDANYYLTDENIDNDFDETPPDVHFEAGMDCVDCHVLADIHGNGHLYADTQCGVSIECEDCHGSVREPASLDPNRPNVFERDGDLWLRTKTTDRELRMVQVQDLVTQGDPDYSVLADQSMGINAADFSHTDDVECYTCHAGWMPNCYGCHVEVDFTREKAFQTNGMITPGFPSGRREWVVLNDLVLMRNSDNKISPSMPAERFFMTATVRDDEASDATGELVKKQLFTSAPRSFTFPDGRTIPGFGQRAFNPHTTRSRSQFMACDRCHSVGDATTPDNEVLLDITFGFGSQRFMQEGCDISNADESCDPETDFRSYALDAIQNRAGEPLVVVGHPDPFESRPLTLEEIDAMRAILVPDNPPFSTPITPDAATDPTWPHAQNL